MSVTDTEIVARLIEIDRSDNVQVMLYATKGYAGMKTVTIDPKLTQVSPQAGSKAGTEITFTTVGIGKNDEISSSLAGDVVSRTYTSVTFKTKAKNAHITKAAVTISVNGGSNIACENADSSLCEFETTDALTPKVTSSSFSGSTLTLSGSDIPTDADSIKVVYGEQTDSAATSTSSAITATIIDVPGTITPEVEVIYSDRKLWADVSSGASVTTALTVSSSTATTCSFGGGCELEITASGIDTLV